MTQEDTTSPGGAVSGPVDVPATMRAAAIDRFGPPDVLRVRRLPVPVPGPDEVLVRVVAAGVQPADAAVRAGWAPPGARIVFPQVLGNEFAGQVVGAGAGVTAFAPGDPVVGFRVLGCYAEYVAAPVAGVVRKPDGVPWDQAGGLSASGQTAHTALAALGVRAGETLLVFGAAGGVGSMAVQLAVARGARVIGTASPGNHAHLRALGAVPVAYGPGQHERIRAAAPDGIDVAFDAAGHGNVRAAVAVVPDRDRVATVVDVELAAELGVRFLRTDRRRERLAELLAMVEAGTVTVHVRDRPGLDGAAGAHRDVETGHGRGKIVLQVAPEGTPR